MSVASRYMCTRRYAPFKLVVCGVLLVLSALVVRAQTPIATTLLDGWRVGFNQHCRFANYLAYFLLIMWHTRACGRAFRHSASVA